MLLYESNTSLKNTFTLQILLFLTVLSVCTYYNVRVSEHINWIVSVKLKLISFNKWLL